MAICIQCGAETTGALCDPCKASADLGELYSLVKSYRAGDPQGGEWLAQRLGADAGGLEAARADLMADIVSIMTGEEHDRYAVLLENHKKGPSFESLAQEYFETYGYRGEFAQELLLYYLRHLQKRSFERPRPLFDEILEGSWAGDMLLKEAAEYFGHIGEYQTGFDLADRISDEKKAEDTRGKIARWKDRRAFWPHDVGARLRLAKIYDAKGIAHRAVYKKVEKKDFAPIELSAGPCRGGLCAFHIFPTYGPRNIMGAYRLCAAHLSEGGELVEEYDALIHPWDGPAHVESATSSSGLASEALCAARTVDLVTRDLLDFSEGLPLVPLGDVGQQLALLDRAVRYAGLRQLDNAVVEPSSAGIDLSEFDACSTAPVECDDSPDPAKQLFEPDFDSFVAFDIEHSGTFGKGRDTLSILTEIGAVKVVDGEVVDRFSSLANPGRAITPRAQEITHISNEDVRDAPPASEVVREFHRFAEGFVLVGHNIKACDLRHINRSARAAGIAFDNEYYDTLAEARALKKKRGWDSASLGRLCEMFGIEQKAAHRALSDAENTAEVYFRLRELG